MDNPYLDAVRRGAALLDTVRPDWRANVNGKRLTMDQYVYPPPLSELRESYKPCAACILGWAFWRDALQWTGALSLVGLRAYTSDAADHGFVIPDDVYEQTDDEPAEWELLLAAWQTVLSEEVAA